MIYAFISLEYLNLDIVSYFGFRASARPGATALETEIQLGVTTRLYQKKVIYNPGLGQGFPV
jgi:hypothetical protein